MTDRLRYNPLLKRGFQFDNAGAESGLPTGGATGQVVKKASNADFDVTWGADNASGFSEVNTFSDLPTATGSGDIYLVLTSSGVWLINRKTAGFYKDTAAATWSFVGDFPVSHTQLQDVGTKTHAQIEADIDSAVAAITDQANTGFIGWTSGSDASTFSVDGTGFTVIRAGYGRISGTKIEWSAGQKTAALTANTTSWIFVDNTGTVGASTTFPSGKIALCYCWYDGTNYLFVKENHPYAFPSRVASLLHATINVFIRGLGCLVAKVASGDGSSNDGRKIKIVGADTIDDHGLTTAIPDSVGAGVTWHTAYLNAAGKYILHSDADQIQMLVNLSGTPTALDVATNICAVHTLYAMQDNINSSSPQFIAVMGSVSYATPELALAAITAGSVSFATNELKGLEPCQIGYAIVQYTAAGGIVERVVVAKSTFGASLVGGSPGGSHNLQSNLDYASSGHTDFASQAYVDGLVGDIDAVLDAINGEGI